MPGLWFFSQEVSMEEIRFLNVTPWRKFHSSRTRKKTVTNSKATPDCFVLKGVPLRVHYPTGGRWTEDDVFWTLVAWTLVTGGPRDCILSLRSFGKYHLAIYSLLDFSHFPSSPRDRPFPQCCLLDFINWHSILSDFCTFCTWVSEFDPAAHSHLDFIFWTLVSWTLVTMPSSPCDFIIRQFILLDFCTFCTRVSEFDPAAHIHLYVIVCTLVIMPSSPCDFIIRQFILSDFCTFVL
jgi:hypothetical protein